MSKRRHRSAAQWRELIDQQADSGLTGADFCERHGLTPKVFYRQRKVLREKAESSTATPFIRVQPKSASAMSLQPGAILQYRDSRLQLSSGVDPVWLAQLMKAL